MEPNRDRARSTTLDVLRAVDRGASWHAAWKRGASVPALSDLDRRFAQELASGVLRGRGRLDWIASRLVDRPLEKLDPEVRLLLRLGLYQLLEMDRVPAHSAVHTTVELAKQRARNAAGYVNAILRAAQRLAGDIAFPDRERDPVAYLETALSHPRWIVERWLQRYGLEETEALCAYGNRRPELCLRVNRLRATRVELLPQLPGSVPGAWSEVAVRCPSPAYRSVRAVVESGVASVQDESGMLVAPLLEPRPGQHILDLAAAPGGKACHVAELLDGSGAVLAFDRTPGKLERVRANARRLGLTNVQVAQADSRTLQVSPADAVLLDAPCSGLGVLARRPDLRWRKQPEDLPRLQELQLELLEAAARHVRPGGVLVYSVCSFEPEETIEVVQRFDARHPEMRPEDAGLPAALRTAPGVLYFLPQRHGIDGGFAARWRRS